MKKLLIWGAGDQGLVTLDCALATGGYASVNFLCLKGKERRQIPGYVVYDEDEKPLAGLIAAYDEVIVATGSNAVREEKAARLLALGARQATLVHPSAVVSPSAQIAQGSAVLAGAVVNPNARIGAGCIVNTRAIVEHDCVIGDYANICPGVSMAGHVSIGRKAYLGIGCTVIDGIVIGEEAVVGAGAVVIRDVPAGEVVAGVPARRLREGR